ncbi:Crp/Fnr family transcriptional regulator [Nitrospira sp. BLG_2]|uniref:Crp/Fnr family transcriptional regulator n=1 Tax=Nitrospira sp. BLG_2 TaxID=3397507 RepID=UPI003B9A1412
MELQNLFPKHSILQNLLASERELITRSCETVDLHLGDIIEEAGRPIQFLHFPINSAISLTNTQDQEHIVEVTVTGREGCSGSSIVLGDDRSPCLAMVQIPGTAIRLAAAVVMDKLTSLPYLHAAMARYNLLIMNLAVISVGCSQFHSPAQRLARWLKAHWQRTGLETFPFSSDFLALQVGVDSAIVKEALKDFQKQGLLELGLNRVIIADQDGLEGEACRCYTLAKESVEEYTGALGKLAKSLG